MDSEGWHYFDNRRKLEDLFRQAFSEETSGTSGLTLQLIRVARMAGLFYRYGLNVDDKHLESVVTQANPSFKYIEAFCSAGD